MIVVKTAKGPNQPLFRLINSWDQKNAATLRVTCCLDPMAFMVLTNRNSIQMAMNPQFVGGFSALRKVAPYGSSSQILLAKMKTH
jgi:hypothetical protein